MAMKDLNAEDDREEIKLFIIEFLIKENKPPEFIKEELNKFGICEGESIPRLKKYIESVLNYRWSDIVSCWQEQMSLFPLILMKLNMEQDQPCKIIKIPLGIEMQRIEKIEVACALLPDEGDVTISNNDAKTIMKNIAAIQSKLNEITNVLNKIGEILNDGSSKFV